MNEKRPVLRADQLTAEGSLPSVGSPGVNCHHSTCAVKKRGLLYHLISAEPIQTESVPIVIARVVLCLPDLSRAAPCALAVQGARSTR